MTDNTVVIYHGGCYDGFCCAWIARKFYPNANFVHSYYDDKLPDVIGKDVYILDYSFPPDILTQICDVANRVVLCDHHKTFQPTAKIFKHYKLIIKFDNMKSGARLTWEHFFGDMASHWLVDYTEDRDLWNWKLPFSKEINACLRSHPFNFELWDTLSALNSTTLIPEGVGILRREKQIIDSHVQKAKEVIIGGHKVLGVNATSMPSEIGNALAIGRPFGAVYFIREDGKKVWSLRSTDEGLDVSEIAKSFGGGGHRNAAGFVE